MNRTPIWLMMTWSAIWLASGCASGGAELPKRATTSDMYMVTSPPRMGCGGAPSRQWAAVIGVNRYQDERIPDLEGAVNDAWTFYHYLASPGGGRVAPQRLQLLLNEEATHKNVLGVLGNFLAEACPQDQVIIYFAGHGAPESRNPEESFLLLHDTDLKNLVGSAVSMSRLPDFLKWRTGQTGRLLMIVDACHSGAIVFPDQRGAEARPASKRVQLVAASLERVTEQFQGWGALAAAASDQFAMEASSGELCSLGGQPYQGGLFTCRLLQGLTGEADSDKDAVVNLDELVSHLNRTVPADTNGQQRPQLSGNLDGTMPLSRVQPDAPVPIPTVPERYVKEIDPNPLRPWVWVGASLTVAAAATGAVYYVRSENLAEEINSGITGKDDEFNRLQSTAIISFAAAGGLAALTLTAFLLDEYGFNEPGDINDVYEQPPWFRLVGVAPTDDGAIGTVQLEW